MTEAAATTTTADTSTGQQTGQQASNQPWYGSNVEELDLGYMQNKGWDKPDGGMKAVKSYRELEKMVGTIKGEPERIIVMPKDMQNKEEVAAYRAKLGVPNDIKEYGFDEKDAIGSEFAKVAHEKGYSKEQAQAAREFLNTYVTKAQEAKLAEQEAAAKAGLEEFRVESGRAYEQSLEHARAAAIAFPLLDKNMEKIEAAMGTADFLRFITQLGAKSAEAQAVGLGNEGGGNFAMTPAMAKDKIVSFKADPVNAKAMSDPGHPAHMKTMAEFNRLYDYAYPNG